jgi:phospholipid/cholesterol/gamma-HCH transport system substrate-binding protein
VRFSGLPVGRVVNVGLSPGGDGTIRVRVEIDADTPVRVDSRATIEAQGVTGVSFVGISPGSPEAALLEPPPGEDIAEIEAGRSALQSLSEDAPQLLAETLDIVSGISDFLNEENRASVETILRNVEDASGNFAAALDDFSTVTASVSDFADQIDNFNAMLEDLTGAVSVLITTGDETLESIGTLARDSRGSIALLDETLARTQDLLASAERYIEGDLTTTTTAMTRLVADLDSQVAQIGAQTQTMLNALTTTSTTATARLGEAETTLAATDALIARLDATLATIDRTAGSLDTLVSGDGAALVADARVALTGATSVIDSIGAAAATDLPVIVSDLRAAAATVARVAETAGADLSSASGRIDVLTADTSAMVAQVTTTFADANDTLAAINGALVTGESALAAATRIFEGTDRIINEEAAGIIADLRGTITRLDTAIGLVAADIPAISADLQAASGAARTALVTFNRAVEDSAGPVASFAATGLPGYTRLAQEARDLIDNLDALTQQIQRDPARFFLNRQTPDFRR